MTDSLLTIILAVTFIEVKVLLYLSIKVILLNNKIPTEAKYLSEEDSEEKDSPFTKPKSYDDLVSLVNKL